MCVKRWATSHYDPMYYLRSAKPIPSVSILPTGVYVCRMQALRCPGCRKRVEKLTLFLPVRDQEKVDEVIFFKNDELGELVGEPSQPQA